MFKVETCSGKAQSTSRPFQTFFKFLFLVDFKNMAAVDLPFPIVVQFKG